MKYIVNKTCYSYLIKKARKAVIMAAEKPRKVENFLPILSIIK